MNRRTLAAGLGLLLAGALVGGGTIALAAPGDPCDSTYTGSMNSTAKLKAYEDCRFDRLEKAVKDLDSISPEPSATPSPSASGTPAASPSPSATDMPSESPSATPSASQTQSATPSPSATPAGWPNAGNTGVPAGTTLTAYTGPCTVTVANTVIDKKRVPCLLDIRAAGVKVTNSEVKGIQIDENRTGASFSISDSNAFWGNTSGTVVGARDFTMTRVHVTGGNRSVHCWMDCTIQDSYVHDQYEDKSGVSHESGIRMGARAKILRNTIACDAPDYPPDAGCSAPLTGYGDFATVENNLIERNYFVTTTGGYCAYGGSGRGGKPYDNAFNIVFRDNVFERGTKNDHGQPDCAYYGAVTGFYQGRGNVFENNRYDMATGPLVIPGGP